MEKPGREGLVHTLVVSTKPGEGVFTFQTKRAEPILIWEIWKKMYRENWKKFLEKILKKLDFQKQKLKEILEKM